jgi:hypothetical protein
MPDFSQVNHLAALAAAVSAFVLGGLWYSPMLFGRIWAREAGVDMQKTGHPAKVFGGAFVMALIASYLMATLLGNAPSLHQGLHLGLLVGAGFVATSFGINYLFAQRTFTLWLIDGGYHIGQFVLVGLILGLWH